MTWSTSATSSPPRANQSSGPSRRNDAAYSLIFSGPANICRFPSMCTIRKAIIPIPVTAMTAFFPIEECQNRATAFARADDSRAAAAEGAVISASARRPSDGKLRHRLAHRLGALAEIDTLLRRQLDLEHLLQPTAAKLDRNAKKQPRHAVLALEPRGARQDPLLVIHDRFGYLHGA